MAECDLCNESDTVLYPVLINPMGMNRMKHLCPNCIEAVKEIDIKDK